VPNQVHTHRNIDELVPGSPVEPGRAETEQFSWIRCATNPWELPRLG